MRLKPWPCLPCPPEGRPPCTDMRFDIMTLFPEMFAPFVHSGIARRAYAQGLVDLHLWNLRDFAPGNYRRVDDRPFGGGPGMVMMAEPLALCLQAIRDERRQLALARGRVLLFSPAGLVLNHKRVAQEAEGPGSILICGRYEGLDQRFIDSLVDEQLSLGDFVLSGGEIAALALLDAVARLQPGVLGDAQSHVQDSFNPALSGLLDCGHYTQPRQWRGQSVPGILLSGDHAAIARWRRQQSLQMTRKQRPDLLQDARRQGLLNMQDEQLLESD